MEIKIIDRPNLTIDFKKFPKTTYTFVNILPKCAKCGIEIKEDENCWFCFLAKKFFCYDCNMKNQFVCNDFFGAFQNHRDALVKIKLKK